jgi:hypothetical protein
MMRAIRISETVLNGEFVFPSVVASVLRFRVGLDVFRMDALLLGCVAPLSVAAPPPRAIEGL